MKKLKQFAAVLTAFCCLLGTCACQKGNQAASSTAVASSEEAQSALISSKEKAASSKSAKSKKTSSAKKTSSKAKKSTSANSNQQNNSFSLTKQEQVLFGMDSELYPEPLVNKGNSARIANLMKKAQNGGKYTIAVLGGSISQGAGSTNGKSYGALVCKWWQENFPKAQFTFVNAGLGATTPQMACYRVQSDLLRFNPDFVVVDFTVNTWGDYFLDVSYSTLLYRLLTQKNAPAVMAIHFTCCDRSKYGAANYVKGITEPDPAITAVLSTYQIPTVSYHQYIWKKIDEKVFNWREVGSDYIHPNNTGHSIASILITKHLEYVKNNVSKLAGKAPAVPALAVQNYLKADCLTNTSAGVKISGGIQKLDGKSPGTRGWRCEAGSTGTLEFTVPTGTQRAYVFGTFASGSKGTVTVTPQNGQKKELPISSATIPTLMALDKGQTSYKLEANLTAGSFTIYNISLDK